MSNQFITSVIPENIKGKSLDFEHHVEEDSIEKAIKTFERAAARLVNPPIWHTVAGPLSAIFALYSPEDINPKRLADMGDYFTIDIPGPGPAAGDGFDWVKVEALEHDSEADCDTSLAMRLRASSNPAKANEGAAHFFNENATSTFIIKRIGKQVVASYHGRNEMANTNDVPIADKVRNKVVATGAEAGFSNLQWAALIKGLLQPELGE